MALQAAADDAYRGGDFEVARKLYTQALACCAAATEVSLLLNNKAQCRLVSKGQHDAVALATASLRLQESEKARYSVAVALMELGEFDLAKAADSRLLERCAHLAKEACVERKWGPSLNVEQDEWVGAVEVVEIAGKGRGVRAARDFEEGEVILFERARVSVRRSDEAEMISSVNTKTRFVSTDTQVRLVSAISVAAQTDTLLSSVIAALSDGSFEKLPLVPLPQLLNRLSPRCLPLLGQHPDFFPAQERIKVPYGKVEGVVSINCHGEKDDNGEDVLGNDATMLFPATSMINHASTADANACWLFPESIPKAGGIATIARKKIKSGEEITVTYAQNAAKAGNKWGIPASTEEEQQANGPPMNQQQRRTAAKRQKKGRPEASGFG